MSDSIGWLSVQQVTKPFGISTITVSHWIETEKMPCHRVGRQWGTCAKAKEVDQWVTSEGAFDIDRVPSKNVRKDPSQFPLNWGE